MTYHKSEKPYVHYVHISPYFASPQGKGFPPSPEGTLNTQPNYRGNNLSFDQKQFFQVAAEKLFLILLGDIKSVDITDDLLDVFRHHQFIGII